MTFAIPGAPELARAGVNVIGALATPAYDSLSPPAWCSAALLPEARSALVLGCGGRAFGEAFLGSPEAALARDPVDRYTARVVGAAVARLRAEGDAAVAHFYWERRGGAVADFVALGAASGLGWPSRLGLLLHPRYGPWLSLRAVVLTGRRLPAGAPLAGPPPCARCPAPCASACPAAAPRVGGFDTAACATTTRATPACQRACAARRACVLGPGHAFSEPIEARYRRTVAAYLAR